MGVDRQVAATGQVSLVAGAFHGSGADPVGLVGAGDELFGDGERGRKGQRGEGVDQQGADGGVDARARDALADGRAVADPFGLADILGHLAAGSGVVAHRHAGAADPADDQALQQRGSFAGWAGAAVGATGGGQLGQAGLVGLKRLEGEVAGVGVGDQHRPLLAGQYANGGLAAGPMRWVWRP